ncbi:RGCVC family protein [Geodermatophilus sp. CPCC 206100]|uniref:RGCVC family protein n=1 Tax=Geodermatophilus sp. CPCC 206100 TaxID=3020054 RepID=UPI003B0004B6
MNIRVPHATEARTGVRSPAERAQALADTGPQPRDGAMCAVCPHAVARHDSVGLRFCHATLRGSISRGCACRSS